MWRLMSKKAKVFILVTGTILVVWFVADVTFAMVAINSLGGCDG